MTDTSKSDADTMAGRLYLTLRAVAALFAVGLLGFVAVNGRNLNATLWVIVAVIALAPLALVVVGRRWWRWVRWGRNAP